MGFPGQYRDSETDTWQNWMRDYSALIGRYLESDPTRLKDGLKTYVYARANPLRHSDPHGVPAIVLVTVDALWRGVLDA